MASKGLPLKSDTRRKVVEGRAKSGRNVEPVFESTCRQSRPLIVGRHYEARESACGRRAAWYGHRKDLAGPDIRVVAVPVFRLAVVLPADAKIHGKCWLDLDVILEKAANGIRAERVINPQRRRSCAQECRDDVAHRNPGGLDTVKCRRGGIALGGERRRRAARQP